MRFRLLVATGAALALINAGCSSGSDDSSEESVAPAIDTVLSALDAKNDLDLEQWLEAHEGGSRQGVPIFAEEILMNANQRWEVIEPCRLISENSAGDTIVECLIVNTDDFWGVGDIYSPKDLRFGVNTDGLITTKGVTGSNSFASFQRNQFNLAFHQWLSEKHPDEYAEMNRGRISSNGPGFDTQNPDHMLIAVDHVEEFVAQSDVYPLDRSDQ